MDIDEVVFDTYVICPLCKAKLRCLSGSHLKDKHGYSSIREFRLEYGIPMNVALVCRETKEKMRAHGMRRREWFRENAMPIGLQMAQKQSKVPLVPKESRKHMGALRRGQSWIPEHRAEMREQGWLDLHEVAKELGIGYNYARKCATEGRFQTFTSKGIRFMKPEWVEDAKRLLYENRIKYHKPKLIDKYPKPDNRHN